MTQPPSAGGAPSWDASTYDRVADPQTRWGVAVLQRLHLRGDETVIDAGCGTGRVTERLLQRLPRGRVVALDASPEMLAEARRRLGADPRVRWVLADLARMVPPDLGANIAPVDAVFSTATFHWVTDQDALFTNIAAVLRPGGRLVAQCGGQGNIDGLSAVVRSLGVERAGTWVYPSVEETVARLDANGFTDVRVGAVPEPTPFADAGQLTEFLEAVCLREAVATMTSDERRDFLAAVVARMPERVIDYVRLNIDATRR